MKLALLALIVSLNVIASGEWYNVPRTEDENFLFYVGVAEGKGGVSSLQDKAFNKAMGELIREHFGMSIQINESAVEELQKEQFQVVTKQSSAPLFIKGIGLVKTYEKELDDGNRVYVQIRAEKKFIKEAIQNQIAKPGDDALNTFGEHHDSKIDIKVKTSPQGSLIHFTALDRRLSLQGQGDARFFLPRGRYQMVVSSPGYSTVSKEVNLMSEGREETIILEELNGKVDLEVFPDDARIVFQGNNVKAGSHKIQVGKTHKFTFSHPDYFTQELEFVLENPETVQKVVKLSPKPGTLYYEIHPWNASIYVDGREVFTNKGRFEVEPGKHQIKIKAHSYFEYEEEVYVRANRDNALRVVHLKYDDINAPLSDKGFVYRFELNPLHTLNQVGYGMYVPPALHFEYKYISIGGGFGWMNYKKKKDENFPEENEIDVEDFYGTIRLISPSFWNMKIYAAGTMGQYHIKVRDHLGDDVSRMTKTYKGYGGGLRGYLTPKWSIHAEYYKVDTFDAQTNFKKKEDRVLAGFAYEF